MGAYVKRKGVCEDMCQAVGDCDVQGVCDDMCQEVGDCAVQGICEDMCKEVGAYDMRASAKTWAPASSVRTSARTCARRWAPTT